MNLVDYIKNRVKDCADWDEIFEETRNINGFENSYELREYFQRVRWDEKPAIFKCASFLKDLPTFNKKEK
jgi:hypothetical protein